MKTSKAITFFNTVILTTLILINLITPTVKADDLEAAGYKLILAYPSSTINFYISQNVLISYLGSSDSPQAWQFNAWLSGIISIIEQEYTDGKKISNCKIVFGNYNQEPSKLAANAPKNSKILNYSWFKGLDPYKVPYIIANACLGNIPSY